jgi:ABC-type transport system involved in multi-copper enzyme maturation permease subunit
MMTAVQAQPELQRTAPVVMGRKDYWSVLLRLVGMDLYKVRRRLMAKVLLITGILIVAGVFFLTGMAGWYTASKPLSSFVPPNCAVHQVDGCVKGPVVTQADIQHFRQAQVNRYAQNLNMPGIWSLGGLIVMEVLSILAIILAGALVGGEYSLGTVRLMFTRGPTRLQFLFAKIAVLAIYIVPALLLLMLVGTLVGSALSPLVGVATNFSFFTAAWLGHFVLYLLLGMLFWFGYAVMALFFGTVGRSTVAGIVGPLVWLSTEPLLNRIVVLLVGNSSGGLADFVKAVPDYFLGNNLSSLVQDQAHALSFGDPAPYSDGHSLLVVAVYLVVFIGIACWLTVRRDVTH